MLHLTSAGSPEPLAADLARVLAEPPPDLLCPEWIAVPSGAMRRWLALELARSLGASVPGAGDGIAANIDFAFPDALRRSVLAAGSADAGDDGWEVGRLVWAILDVLEDQRGDARLGPLNQLPEGATRFGRARRLADLFDRYAVRRPELVTAWHAGRDVDATGRALAAHDRWQPYLWRAVRSRIVAPSPPERLPELLAKLRDGTLLVDLPSRLAVFGVTTLPGGAPFLDLVSALGAHRDVHVMFLDPSSAATRQVRAATLASAPRGDLLRSDDQSERVVHHPLLRSWGRPYRERAVLLAAAEREGVPSVRLDNSQGDPADSSVLARLQRDLRSDAALAGDFHADTSDRSIAVHSCQGPARQVEVLRDAILHLLADDPSLCEEDIAVLCPDIVTFAPLVTAAFGRSAESPAAPSAVAAPPLRYRVADRSLREAAPVLGALDALLALVAGRCTATELLAFIALPPVRHRYGFDDDDLRVITDWAIDTNARWGFDSRHRAAWGLPPELTANTWRAALDRILVGVAVTQGDLDLAVGGIAPLGVEGEEITLAGHLGDLLARLEQVALDFSRPRPAAAWSRALRDCAEQFFAVEADATWQLAQLRRVVAAIGDEAVVAGEAAAVALTLSDVRRHLADRLDGTPARSDYFRGGITVSSLTPLRGLPFRVVCILGFDDASTSGSSGADGDDLAALAPRLGDRDPRAETRQALLEAVLAAGDHLVITRQGRDLRTNREVPFAVAYAELRDAILSTLTPESRTTFGHSFETVHPRQAFDDKCFEPGALGRPGPWSFDPGALASARARGAEGERATTRCPPLAAPSPMRIVTLDELRVFLDHPLKFFLRGLGLHLASEDRAVTDDLSTSLSGLDKWSAARRLIDARLAGRAADDWERYERALGALPPGRLGATAIAEITALVDALLDEADRLGVDHHADARHPVDVELRDGTRIVGEVVGSCPPPMPGPATVTWSRARPGQLLRAWIDLVALTATAPDVAWRSVAIRRDALGKHTDALELVARGEGLDERRALALDGLEVALDCYRRGQREPVPLFKEISQKLHAGNAKAEDWIRKDQTGQVRGDGTDEATVIAFGNLSFHELNALPCELHDPAGTSSRRATRYASYLWEAVASSSEPRP